MTAAELARVRALGLMAEAVKEQAAALGMQADALEKMATGLLLTASAEPESPAPVRSPEATAAAEQIFGKGAGERKYYGSRNREAPPPGGAES